MRRRTVLLDGDSFNHAGCGRASPHSQPSLSSFLQRAGNGASRRPQPLALPASDPARQQPIAAGPAWALRFAPGPIGRPAESDVGRDYWPTELVVLGAPPARRVGPCASLPRAPSGRFGRQQRSPPGASSCRHDASSHLRTSTLSFRAIFRTSKGLVQQLRRPQPRDRVVAMPPLRMMRRLRSRRRHAVAVLRPTSTPPRDEIPGDVRHGPSAQVDYNWRWRTGPLPKTLA